MEDGVSICITAYDSCDYIKECLDSVVSQTWFEDCNNWEIIVGVDGSFSSSSQNKRAAIW